MKNKKIIIVVLAVILLVALAIAVPLYWYMQNNYVAKVGNKKISKAEYTYYLMNLKDQVEQGQNFADEAARKAFWEGKTPDGVTWEEYVRNAALQFAKQNEILLEKAKESGLQLTKEEKDYVKQESDSFISQYGQGKRIEADKQMKSIYGITLAQYESILKDQILISKYYNNEQNNIQSKITDDEINKYYQDNPKEFDKVTVRHILFATVDITTQQPLSQDKQDEAKAKAEETLQRVRAGEDMVTLAKELSQDPAVSQNEGKYVFAETDNYDQDFKNWAFSAKVGDTGIVKSSYGYHVMKLEDRSVVSLNDARDQIKSSITSKKWSDQMEALKNDPKYNMQINNKVYNSIKIIT